jgi:thioredoxin 1
MENEEQKVETVETVEETGKKKKRKIVLLAGVVVVLLAAAASFYFFYFGNPSFQALAKVNDEKITVEQFNKELSSVENPLKDMYREEPNEFLEGMIIRTILLQEAKKQGLSSGPKTYKDTTKEALSPEDSLIAELMKKRFSTPPTVTREEIEALYTIFKDRLGGKPLKEVAPMIEQYIGQQKQQEELNRFIGDLRKNSKVEIDQDRLKKIAAKPLESNTLDDFKKAISSGKPVLVDFGANSCVPCREMRPVLKEVDKEYAGKASVLVIDVYKNQDLAKEYKIQLIPTLVFFDSKGKETFRHVGVLNKEQIATKFKEIGT